MTLTLDHVIIAVDDLEQSIADYTALGFDAFFGGEHAAGTTHNALICLSDGSYIELIAATGKPPVNATVTDFRHWLDPGEGLIGYALMSDDLDADIAAIQARGLVVNDTKSGGRLRADGVELKWRSAGITGRLFPFLIEDVTPRERRVPINRVLQPNGVIGIAALELAVADGTFYEQLLGTSVPLMVGDVAIKLQVGADQDMFGGLKLRTSDALYAGKLDTVRTHGAAIELVLG